MCVDVDDGFIVKHARIIPVSHLANDRTAKVESLSDFGHAVDVLGCDFVAHPLLGLGEQDLEGVHIRLALVDALEFNVCAETAFGDEFARGTAEAAAQTA